MKFDLLQYIVELLQKHRLKKRWQKIVSAMAAIVVFSTTYALILPAITMENTPVCGMEEHTHTEECYEMQLLGPQPEIVCAYASGDGGMDIIHTHDEFCYDNNGNLICELSELEEHTHSGSCYREKSTLICDLEEEYHAHTDRCYTQIRGELSCGMEKIEGHSHGDSCYRETEELTCSLEEGEEHSHDDSCYSTTEELICDREEEESHSHDDDCYTWEPELTCTLAENLDGHAHTDACYESHKVLSCDEEEIEEHTHSGSCYDSNGDLTCEKTEAKVHQHTQACIYVPEGEPVETKVLVCEKEEHTHTDACYPIGDLPEKEYQCGKEEHTHTDACLNEAGEIICGLEEHTHTDACEGKKPGSGGGTEDIADEFTCGLEEHTHVDACYDENGELICGKEEHIHTSKCLIPDSDETADVETSSDWERTLRDVVLTGNWAKDLVAVAESQLGYMESSRNYIVDADGRTKGYTRYGDWYGDAYGDWCAMFASFCLHYAQIDAMPLEANCQRWINKLSDPEYDLYRPAEEYTPKKGDLVFFNNRNADEAADHVGIVVEYKKGNLLFSPKIKTIEGNSSDRVQHVTYQLDDARIMGYAELPENPNGGFIYLCGKEEHTHSQACYNAEGELICGLEEHIHDESCLAEPKRELTAEEMALVQQLIAIIDELPSSAEIEATFMEFDTAGDDAGYEAYVEEVFPKVKGAYAFYQSFSPEMQEMVTNADKLLDLEWIWGAMNFAITDTVNVYAVNRFSWEPMPPALIVHSDSGVSVGNSGMSETDFLYWYAVRVEKENGVFVVKQVELPGMYSSKANVYASGNGFVLLFHQESLGTSVNVNVGDTATVSSDFWKTTHPYNNGQVYGTVTFSTASAQKAYKDNSGQLHIVGAADTRDFIELNLYDYGSGSTGKNINDKFNADKKMPGFQQSGGTSKIPSLDDFKGTSYMNFGDIITSDLADGRLVTLASENPQGINVVKDTANSPISRYSEVMQKTLSNGYPALVDGTSLGYLFGAESYSKKMNTQSVNGLFQYNETTGAYSFNSRENFAQYNQSDDTFTLYDEIFTPNFIMYPFGNFMPFNDIVHDSKQVSQINQAYFKELMMQANYLYQQGNGDQYAQLARVLGQFMDYAKQDGWVDGWTAERALQHYFYWGNQKGELPSPNENDKNYNQISLDRLYSLDYDVASDFYFGMEMKMNFMQPKGGLTGKDGKQPMVFYFTGDDDVWVYIDNQLFLDLSGIHRHVGGKIDFVNGEVSYYSLDTKTGDVSDTPYKTVKFSDLVADQSMLNANGTFKDYSSHSFNFYYMERGSGSSVCRLNFNFPLLRKNSISVTKELSADGSIDALGNPDFYFQVMNKTTDAPYFGENVAYTVYDGKNQKIAERTTGSNGLFHIKAGETAVFEGIAENSPAYYVRELLELSSLEQYGSVEVNGNVVQTENGILIDTKDFKGFKGPDGNPSDGSTAYTFNNKIELNKFGSLDITKKLEKYTYTRAIEQFEFMVKLDGEPLPVGTKYKVGDTEKTVQTEGIVLLRADEKAHIANILAGSKFEVTELNAAEAGYTVVYSGDGNVTDTNGHAAGTIIANASVAVTVINTEKGSYIKLPVEKTLLTPDGTEHTYTFKLKQVTDSTGMTEVENGTEHTAEVSITEGTKQTAFTIPFIQADITSYPAVMYYKITEENSEGDRYTQYDNTVYVAEVTVSRENGVLQAELTDLWKDGSSIDAETKVPVFENTLSRSLAISKTLEGNGTETKFDFEVNVTGAQGNYTAVRSSGSGPEIVSFTDGKAFVTIAAEETLTIYGLPANAQWSVTELTKGYTTTYEVNSNGEQAGMTASGSLDKNSSVAFVNKDSYALPSTGGMGTKAFYTMGGLLMLGAALLAYKRCRRW